MKRRGQKKQHVVHAEAEGLDLKLVAQITARVPGELALRLRKVCQESAENFNQIVAEALEQYLDKKKP